jgi:hypothetical protein
VFAATEALALGGTDPAKWADQPPSPLLGDPALALSVLKTQAQALEGMRVGRTLALFALAVACALASVAAARMLRPQGLPREALRRLLSGSLLAAAILRTVDGAQSAVVARRVATQVGLLAKPETREALREALPTLMVGFTALHTALMAGLMLFLGQYFRSERVREQLLGLERSYRN